MSSLPIPTGPYAVGTVSHAMVDGGRPVHVLETAPGRSLFLKLWYPAERSDEEPELLWADLRKRTDLPMTLKLVLWRIGKKLSHSIPAARFAGGAERCPLLIYSHGLVSFAAENTSLMEELASHGFVVLAMEHAAQMDELNALNEQQSPEKREADAAFNKRIMSATPPQRAQMGREYYEGAENSNRIVAARAADIAFAHGHLPEILSHIPGRMPQSIDADRLCVAGLSLGGAVSSEYAHIDKQVRAVINLDGGLYGTHISQPLSLPYLMMYSDASNGINDALLPEGTERHAPSGTAHLNYHDISMLMTELRWFGAVGETKAQPFIDQRNRTALNFLNRQA